MFNTHSCDSIEGFVDFGQNMWNYDELCPSHHIFPVLELLESPFHVTQAAPFGSEITRMWLLFGWVLVADGALIAHQGRCNHYAMYRPVVFRDSAKSEGFLNGTAA